MKYLTLEEVLELHDVLIEKFGGLKGVRDVNLLISAIETPKATMFDEDLYPSVYEKAAAYLYHIVQNHPFNDGNKRTGFGVSYLFLRANKVSIIFDDIEYEDLVVEVAKGNITKEQITYFFQYGKYKA
ncbi:MAG: type II toxin-antitoxin system death-on-curing family toxin [Parachlamydiaceae bacterium]|nr:type II toxin-antitoxin system death-on-curing family toxin [Parachlamydiaceae bacterium]